MALPAKRAIPAAFPGERLEKAIRAWWADEERTLREHGDPFDDLKPCSGSVFDILPSIPSQQAVEVIGLLEPILGRSIPESVIKRGGYRTADEFVDHLTHKLAELDQKET